MKNCKVQFVIKNDKYVLEELALNLYRKYRIKCLSVEPLNGDSCLVTVFSSPKKIHKITELVK